MGGGRQVGPVADVADGHPDRGRAESGADGGGGDEGAHLAVAVPEGLEYRRPQ